MITISSLPPEILLRIFRIYLQTETQYDLMNCVSKVCQNWQELCKDPSLWQEFDGTLPFEVLKEYCINGILKDCTTLVFSKMENFHNAREMDIVFAHLPKLKGINFSYVISMQSYYFFGELISRCPKLQEIVFNDKLHNHTIGPGIVGFPIHGCTLLKIFLTMRGADLVSLIFSNIYLAANIELFWAIGCTCPNLEILKVENIDHDNTISFPTAHMQKQCPKLRILCLGHPVVITNHGHIVGFKNLEIFRNPSQLNYLFPNCAIDSIIFESEKLRELDIRKCMFAKRNCLHPVNYSNLENLNISFGIVHDFPCFEEIIQKWSRSLKVLDISNMTDASLNEMFQSVISNGGLVNVIKLNLSVSSVTIPTLKLIVQNCPQLHILNLESCSELNEFSAKYEGKPAIKMLSSKLMSLDY